MADISAIHQPPAETPQIMTPKERPNTTRIRLRRPVISGVPDSARPFRKCSSFDTFWSATIEAAGSRRTFSA